MNFEEQQKIIDMGRHAQELKNNPALEECMKYTLDSLFAEWCSTSPKDAEDRMAIWATSQALMKFRDAIDLYISQGKFEQSQGG